MILYNSFLSFDITAEARESLTRVNDQLRNIVKVYDSTLLMENQREFIEMSSQIAIQLRDSKVIIKDFGDLSEISNNLVKFAKEMDVSYRDFCKIWQQYDYTKLTKIMQDTLKEYDYNKKQRHENNDDTKVIANSAAMDVLHEQECPVTATPVVPK